MAVPKQRRSKQKSKLSKNNWIKKSKKTIFNTYSTIKSLLKNKKINRFKKYKIN